MKDHDRYTLEIEWLASRAKDARREYVEERFGACALACIALMICFFPVDRAVKEIVVRLMTGATCASMGTAFTYRKLWKRGQWAIELVEKRKQDNQP